MVWCKRTHHSSPQNGMSVVYQESSQGQGHVLLKIYKDGKSTGNKGTTDVPSWSTQEYYELWDYNMCHVIVT